MREEEQRAQVTHGFHAVMIKCTLIFYNDAARLLLNLLEKY